jgi:putative phosphonate catabolism associated alcohol dehydrogenase
MNTSLAAVFSDQTKEFSLQEIEIPSLKEGEILVKVSYTTICRSDLYTFEGRRKEKTPTILGHEIVGNIIAFGFNTTKTDLRGHVLSIGDKITWAIYASNPDSFYAKKGIPQKAEDLFKYGHEQITPSSTLHGGLAEFIILRKNTPIIKILDFIPNSVAALINCSVATVAGSLRLATKLKDQIVLVSGTGMLGTIACAMAAYANAKKVIALDSNINRANQALSFGASVAIEANNDHLDIQKKINDALNNDTTVDVVLEFSGLPNAMLSTLNLLGIGGTAVWVGATFPQETVPVNAEMIVRKLLTIKGLHNYNEKDLIAAVAFIESTCEQYNFNGMVHGGFGLNQITEAYQYALDKNPFRVGIDPTIK